MTEKISDYAAPVHQSLLEPDLVFGVDKGLFALVAFATVFCAIYVSVWMVAPMFFVLLICNRICKKDAHLVEILARSMGVRDVYEK